MARLKRSLRRIILAMALVLGVIIIAPASREFNTLVQAQPQPSSLSNRLLGQRDFTPPSGISSPNGTEGGGARLTNQLPNQWEFNPPSGRGNPDNTEGGAQRGNDCLLEPKMWPTPIIPISGGGLTASAYPTFFWYMPRNNAAALEFALSDSNNQEVYSSKFVLTQNKDNAFAPGIIGLQLPNFPNLSPLEITKKETEKYHWQLAIHCERQNLFSGVSIDGTIQRVALDPNLASKLQTATLQERVALYAENRLWYDTVAALAELRRQNPNDSSLVEAWKKLLDSVNLGAIRDVPIVYSNGSQ